MGLATHCGRRPNRHRNAYNKQPESDETAVARCPRPLTSERAGGSPNMSQIKIDKANVQEFTVNHTSNNHIINQPKTFTLGFPWHSHGIPMAFPWHSHGIPMLPVWTMGPWGPWGPWPCLMAVFLKFLRQCHHRLHISTRSVDHDCNTHTSSGKPRQADHRKLQDYIKVSAQL